MVDIKTREERAETRRKDRMVEINGRERMTETRRRERRAETRREERMEEIKGRERMVETMEVRSTPENENTTH